MVWRWRWLVPSIWLFLCLATAAIFVRSECVPEGIERFRFTPSTYTATAFGWLNGRIVWVVETGNVGSFGAASYGLSLPQTFQYTSFNPSPSDPLVRKWLWAALPHGSRNPGGIIVHTWFIFFPSLALFVLTTRRAIRDRRAIREGRCAKCGYDLRATPDRCPECGTVSRST
jgi:hypothetical protein